MPVRRLVLALAMFVASPALAQEFPALSGRVVDNADLLTPADEAALTAKLEALEAASTRQLVVATVPDLQGYEIEDYGYRLGRAWGIGQDEANNGTILLVAPRERRVRIEVGYGLEPILTDALSSVIVNQAILPRFRDNDYPGGIDAGADAIIEQLRAPPEQAEQRALEAAAAQQQRSQGDGGGSSIFGLLFWGMILAFVILPMFFGRGRKGARGRRYGGSNLPIVLWAIANEMSKSSGRGGGGGGFGGFGGGGGGGFGGFSGGGGSFGGGGASGGW